MLKATSTSPLKMHEPLPQFAMLTPREQDVMLCIARGMPNKIIGDTLGISQRTVEAHRARIFRKLEIRNAVELANYVWRETPPAVASMLTSD
ncbi:MAG TPA: LuxR C-terminal-related transcriptional regulator [Burkholderiaceae bacterium]|nr:LuxR C-terminal-related transcriptional regulator [Burkholderiaceae bacterium]